MSANCSHNCAECHSDCNERTAPQSLLEPLNKNSSVKKVIGVVSGKGGVGKSLVTSMLAVLAQRKGYQAAIMDADITGPSIPKVFGIHGKVLVMKRAFSLLNPSAERKSCPSIYCWPMKATPWYGVAR